MPNLQLTQSYVQLFKSANNTLRRSDFRNFLTAKREASSAADSEKFRHGDAQLAALRRGDTIDESLANAFALFALEIGEGNSELAIKLSNDPKYDYSWANDLTALSIVEAKETLFVAPQQQAFFGSFTQVVQYPLFQIEKAILRAVHKGAVYRCNENHSWCADDHDALMCHHRTSRTFGGHFRSPNERQRLTDEERYELCRENWVFTCSLADWDDQFVKWFRLVPHCHMWAVKPEATKSDDPWKVRISNMTTLPLTEAAYYKVRAGQLGAMDLNDESFFQIPTVYFFIPSAAENPRASFGRKEKALAEMSCLLNQLARMVPRDGHADHRRDLHLLTFAGSPVTENMLKSKSFKPLADFLKEGKPGKCRLYELIMGKNFAYSRARDAVYSYRAHLDELTDAEETE